MSETFAEAVDFGDAFTWSRWTGIERHLQRAFTTAVLMDTTRGRSGHYDTVDEARRSMRPGEEVASFVITTKEMVSTGVSHRAWVQYGRLPDDSHWANARFVSDDEHDAVGRAATFQRALEAGELDEVDERLSGDPPTTTAAASTPPELLPAASPARGKLQSFLMNPWVVTIGGGLVLAVIVALVL